MAAAEDALAILKKVAATYAALPATSYLFEKVEVRDSLGAFRIQSEQRERITGAGGKYRQEELSFGSLYIFDGQFRWAYSRNRNEYTRTPANSPLGRAPGLVIFENVAYKVKSARLLRQETLELASGPVPCQVIEVEHEPGEKVHYSPTTYWIDASRNLVLRMTQRYTVAGAAAPSPPENVVNVSFTTAAVGQPVDESLFRFTPPPDAVQVERLFAGPKSQLAGKDAPEFELIGADGQAITSGGLRGNLVLLQFSPRPEDETLPLIEMIHRSLKDNGLKVIYVLPLRSRPSAGGNLYTVPVALDPDRNTASKFGISYAGTVLIDRAGKVLYADTTSRSSLELAKALQTAGVW